MLLSTKIVLFLILAAVLIRLPVIGKYLSVVHTLVHEIGHQIASVLTFGRAHKIKLFSNTEGLAFSSHRSWFGRVLTALAGYIFSSFIAYAFFYFISIGRYNFMIYILLALLVISLLLIRNWYGFFWIVTFGSVFVWLLRNANGSVVEFFMLFISSILLIESISSAFTIMRLSFQTPSVAGDASSLAEATHIIPAQVWGIIFFAQSLFFGWLALKLFFPILGLLNFGQM